MSEDTKEPKTIEDSVESEETSKKVSDKHLTKQAKKHKKLKIFSIILAVVLIVPILVAGWYGFVPGLSNILGARTPRDLGVRWTEADFDSYKAKTNTNFIDFSNAPDNPNKPGKKTVFDDPKTVDNLQLTQEEITAAINSLGWSWLPATNVQVRLKNGVMEVSGNIKLDHIEQFVNFIGGVGYSNEDVSKAADWGRKLVNGGAFYAQGAASVSNDTLVLDLQRISIGRFNAPMDIAQKVIHTGGSNGIDRTDHLSVASATIGDGSLTFTGTYPTTIYVMH